MSSISSLTQRTSEGGEEEDNSRSVSRLGSLENIEARDADHVNFPVYVSSPHLSSRQLDAAMMRLFRSESFAFTCINLFAFTCV